MVKSINPKFWSPRIPEIQWVGMYCLILASWLALFLFGIYQSHNPVNFFDFDDLIGSLINPHYHHLDFMFLFGMWGIMALAMMLPSFVPTLRVYDDLRSTGSGSGAGYWALTLGYVTVWLIYAIFMTVIQIYLISLNILPDAMGDLNLYPIVILFLLAGIYQLSNFKDRCLTYCRNPLLIFLARGEVGLTGEFYSGIRFAAWCLGCCFFLMALCLITGLMNIAWMGLLAIIITLEKLPDLGKYVSKPLGIVLIATSLIIYIFQ